MHRSLQTSFGLLALATASLIPSALHAQVITFTVDLNTSGLSADAANAPFFLDFQLDYGNSALATNTATLSNFLLTGGSAFGSAVTSGLATGNITGTATLTASAAHPASELYQEFTSGVTNIQFTATVTETGPDVGIPSEFTASILDSSLGSPAQLFTTAPDTASLVTLDLDDSNTLADVNAFSAFASADGNTPLANVTASVTAQPPAVGAVPEPSTYGWMAAGLLAGVIAWRQRRMSGLANA